MGAFFDEIPDESHEEWIKKQKLFFVATAPTSLSQHVNVSPKGHNTLTLVSRSACYYQDLTGSGNETVSHIRDNGRVTVMFCAFEGSPRILRLFGVGKVFERGTKEYEELLPPGDERILPGSRALIWIDIHKVGTSCGYSVPYFDYVKERNTLLESMSRREAFDRENPERPVSPEKDNTKSLKAYWAFKNSRSMDGLPGLELGLRGKPKVHVGGRASETAYRDLVKGIFVGVVLTLVTISWARDGQGALERTRDALQFGYS